MDAAVILLNCEIMKYDVSTISIDSIIIDYLPKLTNQLIQTECMLHGNTKIFCSTQCSLMATITTEAKYNKTFIKNEIILLTV